MNSAFEFRQRKQRFRPIPYDWMQVAPTLTWKQALARWRMGKHTMYRWVKETGVTFMRARHPSRIPEDWASRAHTMTVGEWARTLHYTPEAIRWWQRKLGVRCKPDNRGGYFLLPKRRLEVPRDWPARALQMTQAQLMAHYDVSKGIIQRWARESGVRYKRVIEQRIPRGWERVAHTKTAKEWSLIYNVIPNRVRAVARQRGVYCKPMRHYSHKPWLYGGT